jgi:sugar phosphate isomerase/epimerase
LADKPLFTVSISEEIYGDHVPITLQGGIRSGMETAAQLGYEGVELQLHTPSSHNFQQYCDWAQELGIKITAIGTGLESAVHHMHFTSPDIEVRKRIRKSFIEFIDGASICKSTVFLGLCRGKAPSQDKKEEYLDRLAEEFRILAEYAGEKDVLLVLEPIVFYLTNLLNTTEEGYDFISRPGLEAIRLLLDTHHMFIEDKDMIESFRKAAPKTAYIHISDSNRRYAGGGNVNYLEVGQVLKEIGYDGPLALECLPVPNGIKAAEYSLAWMKQIWK